MLKATVSGAKYSPTRDKWSLLLEMQNKSGEFESAYVFPTEADALWAGFRAVRILEETGKFPNMCEAF